MTSKAEERAEQAQHLPPFQDVNLEGIKAKVTDALKLIGKTGIFSEYTLHDITHVEKMLNSLDWLIPRDTQDAMTPADWLLIVLSIYFHDLGMLVTEEEYEARADSDFADFCAQSLFSGKVGTDYENKVAELGSDEGRFLYQEYVRHHHPDRIADWIQGKVRLEHGAAHRAAEAVAEILSALPATFRADLALVCASHHLNDLYDVEKYRVSRPYGDSNEVTANVQYAALLLRTADLLHMTNDRTPSVMFRLINPQDPISQREWAKQDAVDRVRAQKGKDSAGDYSDNAVRDTIEVFATYHDAEAFFGLTSYLTYASDQLKQASEWARASAVHFDSDYHFPWNHIDSTEVRAAGFSPQQLSFTLDQARILELLTGHTLYNDTGVVLRELVQNALDASRLQAFEDETDEDEGVVTVEWDSVKRELVVRDGGTGMTAAVIEKNLLKAGSSRYQEEEFKEQNPAFSPISRFGIGVLSAFMIADSVEITTCSPHEPQARQLTLRSVHGKYLVRLLDKDPSTSVRSVLPHGTEVRLRVRKSAEMKDVAETLQRWVVIPRCTVKSIIDGVAGADLVFKSPKSALEYALKERGISLFGEEAGNPADRHVKVIEEESGGTCTALAVRWSRYFRQWEFMKTGELRSREGVPDPIGTCVEGVRVEERSPGFAENGVVALVDARGVGAPKTNVARAGLESTPERRGMLKRVYTAYMAHIGSECNALMAERGQSLTWAAQEGEILLELLLDGDRTIGRYRNIVAPVDIDALSQAIRAGKFLLIETDGKRQLSTATDLDEQVTIWTIDSGLVRSAEGILREIPAEGSLSAIAASFSEAAFSLPDGVTLVGYQPMSMLYQLALDNRQVARIAIRPDERRVDLGWEQSKEDPDWLELRHSGGDDFRGYSRQSPGVVCVGRREIPVVGLNGEVAVRAHRCFYLFADSPLAAWTVKTMDAIPDRNVRTIVGDSLVSWLTSYLTRSQQPDDVSGFIESHGEGRIFRRLQVLDGDAVHLEEMIAAFEETPPRTFDTLAWSRRGILV